MKKVLELGVRVAAAIAAFALLGAASAETATPIIVTPVKNLRADFMKGADVSMLDQIERAGGKFYDEKGKQKDALKILKEHGVNWIRLRLWHTPINDADVVEGGKIISRKGDPTGGGNNDLETTLRLAKRGKALGMKFLLDIHYSDFWADPEKQNKPAAWKNLSGVALEQEVYRYTAQALQAFRRAGVFPDMVQIGNELNGGFIWPDGKTWKSKPEEIIGGEEGFASLLRQGIKAVRDTDPNSDPARTPKRGGKDRTKIAIHLANGADNDLYRRVFDQLVRRNIDFDIIGLSFYPYWHGIIDDLRANLDDISSRYGKEVVILETAYAFTTADGDGFPNLFSSDSQKNGNYKATVQGQASLVRDVIDAVAQVPGGRGRGVFYWAPDWIPLKGVGWRTGEGNAWENQAMFDFNGRVLPSLTVFKRVSEKASGETARILNTEPVKLTAFAGERWEPPQVVKLAFSDDAERNVRVRWDSVDASRLTQPGGFMLKGVAEVYGTSIIADVNVAPRTNLILDPSFENGTLEGWSTSGDIAAVSNERNPGNAHTGRQSFHYWLGAPFKFELVKKLTGLQNGTYTLKVWSAGGGGEKAIMLFARDCGEAGMQSASITNTGWQQWKQFVLKDIKVTKSECIIGVGVDANSGNWGNLDDFEFSRDEIQK